MTSQQIIGQCYEQIALTPKGVMPIVTFTIPGPASGDRKKLAKVPGAPFGRIVAEYEKHCLVAFDAKKVLEFIMKTI